ncbi:MAG: alcohol dehydrogenase [Gammaproteobacteria bacterium]|nr:MAG: alcohol dehydrogenase [Gammaproteobacteria bacterium]TND02204.1 MAG: alcohol dehydrogenase [Gammaproteobacteria bacterium]
MNHRYYTMCLGPDNPALKKYARVGEILAGERLADEQEAQDRLVDLLDEWTSRLNLPRLSEYGVSERDVDRIVAGSRGSSMETNPILLEDREIRDIVVRRL